jgi:predicted dehydrogenase
LRFGLVGTGYWARTMHGAGLGRESAAGLAAVWGRDAGKAAALATELGIVAYPDFDDFLGQVDAVSFAIPPDAQAELAIRAARAGKHLLLEKPVATSAAAGRELAEAVRQAGVSSVVFFTSRFTQPNREWLAAVGDAGGWHGAWARWIVSAFAPGSPYADSPWRREKGALWDVGPHALSMLMAALGPVNRVTADAGAGDLAHLIFEHVSGATSTASLTLDAPAEAINVELSLWGAAGLSSMPQGNASPDDAYALALRELMANIAAGQASHPCDVRFGAAVTGVLAEAEQQIAARRSRPA